MNYILCTFLFIALNAIIISNIPQISSSDTFDIAELNSASEEYSKHFSMMQTTGGNFTGSAFSIIPSITMFFLPLIALLFI